MVNLVHPDRIVSVRWLFPERIHGNRLCIDQTGPSTITGSANIRYLEDNDVPIRIDGREHRVPRRLVRAYQRGLIQPD